MSMIRSTQLFAVLLPFVAMVPQADAVKILVQSQYVSELSELEKQYPDLEIVATPGGEELIEKVPDFDAVVGIFSNFDVEAMVRAGTKLKWIQSMSAGVEGYLVSKTLRENDVVLTNGKIIQGPEIADHALGLLLNFTRNLKDYNEKMSGGFQRGGRMPLIELRGKTVLIVGLGGIGTQVAERCAAFGMRVLAVDPKDVPFMNAVEYVGKPDELDALIPEADVLINCAPHTPESEGMIGAAQCALMKDGIYIISVSRGAIIDTEALTAALKSGKVIAAGLDVTTPEPLPADHPLWSMPNVTITPHIAGQSEAIFGRRVDLFRENIQRFLEGKPLKNRVNKSRGY